MEYIKSSQREERSKSGKQNVVINNLSCSNLEFIPCAAYFVKDDADLTLCYGNSAFYDLYNCNEEKMRNKYGDRLSALIAPESLKVFDKRIKNYRSDSESSFDIKIQIKRNNSYTWIYTKVSYREWENKKVLFCISSDISKSEQKMEACSHYISTTEYIAEEINFDVIEYNIKTGQAKLLSAHRVLPLVLRDIKKEYNDFKCMLISQGTVCPNSLTSLNEIFGDIENNGKIVREIEMKTIDNRHIWVRVILSINSKELNGDKCAIGFFEDVTEQKKSYQNYLNETLLCQAILSEKTAYAQIDVTDDKMLRAGGLWNLYNEVISKMTYSSLIEEFISKVVHPEDRKHYLELMQRSNFIEALENGIGRLGCEFRRITEQNRMKWVELTVHLFKDPVTNHTMALSYIKNIDKCKKQKLSFCYDCNCTVISNNNDENINNITAQLLDKGETIPFDAFISEQGDLAYLVDPDSFTLICGNDAFYNRVGMSKTECLGMKCYELMYKRTSPCPFCSKVNWSTDKFYLWKNFNYNLEQEFLIKNKLVQWEETEVMLALAIDISNDKNIKDSINSGTSESSSILSGVEQMTLAENLTDAVNSALETVGYFFNADIVQFWEKINVEGQLECKYTWKKSENSDPICHGDLRIINEWLHEIKWAHPIVTENPESLLGGSYNMYEFMKRNNIVNQRFIQIADKETIFGCILISNISCNFQNVVFLESFARFIAYEIKRRNLMEKILCANHCDELTGLLNRISYEKYLVKYNGECFSGVGVVVANINRLNVINSSKGFDVGNDCLIKFALLLRETFSQSAVFRMNGDEFLVIATDIGRSELNDKIRILEKKVEALSWFTAAIGYSWDNIEKNPLVLVEQSTEAMKVNKKLCYDQANTVFDSVRHEIMKDLIASIENREFEVFLQPKVKLETGEVFGAEALIRYIDKTKGIIAPINFIEKFETNNLIRYIDLFVFEEVCKVLEKWKSEGLFLPVISLNFSRLTMIEHNILSSMESIISKYDVSRSHVEIEITESVSSIGKSILCKTTEDFRNAGFTVSLDDFGTKYTNLAILSDINVDVLKIDKGLIDTLDDQRSLQIILKNIICMCNDLGIDVIAEGVETKAQESVLRKLNCRNGQGYLYGKPIRIEEFSQTHLLMKKLPHYK